MTFLPAQQKPAVAAPGGGETKVKGIDLELWDSDAMVEPIAGGDQRKVCQSMEVSPRRSLLCRNVRLHAFNQVASDVHFWAPREVSIARGRCC